MNMWEEAFGNCTQSLPKGYDQESSQNPPRTMTSQSTAATTNANKLRLQIAD